MIHERRGARVVHGELLSQPGDQPTGLLARLFAPFGRPTGLLGRIAGSMMAKTADDDAWIVDLLDVRPTDRVLEVGCGPGVALAILAERAPAGFVAGIDPSRAMIEQAARRAGDAVRQGAVEVRLGSADRIPYPDEAFTRACSIHTLYFWPSVEAGLHELRRVLAPGGRLVLGVRMRREGVGRLSASRYGLTAEHVADVEQTLQAAGFDNVSTRQQQMGYQSMLAIVAERP
jgi:SAM-dependent methyltransferase